MSDTSVPSSGAGAPAALQAEVVSVGTELLLGQIVDTHAPVMARLLAECGIACQRRLTMGDNMARLTEALRDSLSRSDIVITIGGLGPTADDLTRDAIAAALDDELVLVPEVESRLREFFATRGMTYSESNSRQATRPSCAVLIDNPNGTAPGLLCRKDGKVVIALPGPAGEFNPMAFGPVKEYLSSIQAGSVIHSRTLRIIGIGESAVEEQVKHLMEGGNPTVAPYAHVGEVHLRLTARASTAEEADHLIDPVERAIRDILGNAVYGTDDTTLETAVIHLFKAKGRTLAVAESVTGGGLGARLTSVPGCSAVFTGGIIAYTLPAKINFLGVTGDVLDRYGPVSAECARAMAVGVASRMKADFGIAITGNSGPTPDVDDKPIGLIYAAVAGPEGIKVEEALYRGIREDIRRRATQLALRLAREAIL